jgi:hypothetical protein
MDAKSEKIQELIARNDAARQALACHWHALRHRADIPARISENIRSHRTLWFAGATTFGLFASSLLRRKKSAPPAPRTRKGWLGFALTTAFALAKPALKSWLWNQAQKRFNARRASGSPHFSD